MEDTFTPGPEHLLLFLLVGLDAQREHETHNIHQAARFYPYPDPLRVAWNALGYQGLTSDTLRVPRTLSGLLKRGTEPVSRWLSPALIPTDFPPNAPLLYPGPTIELSDAAAAYLNDCIFSDLDFAKFRLRDALSLNRFLENQRFVEQRNRLRGKPWTPAVQEEYRCLRRFLIEHPYTTRTAIVRAFGTAAVLSPGEVGKMYADCSPHETYYRCEKCGLLRRQGNGNRLVGAKPDYCSDHAVEAPHVHRIPWENGLCRLFPGVHDRLTVYGIAEIALFDRLHALHKKYPKRIAAVEEWPDIDSYDLRVVFTDGVAWAVDVKDFASPERLAPALVPLAGRGSYARFDRAFYVVPQRRLPGKPHYFDDARKDADRLPPDYTLCDDDSFVAFVAAYRPKKAPKELQIIKETPAP